MQGKSHQLTLRGVALAVVLGAALVLRFWAVDWGAPYLYHPDEHLVLHPALNIVRDGDLNPHWFQYPSLLIYLQAGIVATLQPFVHAPLTTDAAVNRIGPWDALPAQWPFALGGRLLVAASAVIGAWLLYRAGAQHSAPSAGLAAALFLVASPLHNESTHYLTTDVPATTLLTAVLLATIAGTHAERPRRLVAAAFLAGLAAATKYTAGVVLIVPLLVAFSSSLAVTARRVGALVAAAAAGFLIGCPFALLDVAAFGAGLLQQRQNYLGGYSPGSNWLWYLMYLYDTGLSRPLAVLCALGLIAQVAGLLRESGPTRRINLGLVSVPILYFAVVSSYPSRAERNLIILLPFLCLLGADLLWRCVALIRRPSVRMAVFGLAALLIAAPGITASLRNDRRLARPDTRTVALEWIEANIPRGSRIVREEYTPQVAADRYDVIYLWSAAFRGYAWCLDERVDYLVLSSNVYGRALNPPYVVGPSGPPFYQFVFSQLPLVVEIGPTATRTGPTIRIYRVPHG